MKHYLLLLILLFSGFLFAQEPNHSNLEELHNRKLTFIVEKADLTPQEVARIKPLFMEYEQAVWKIMESNRDFFKQFHKNKEERGESDYQAMNDRYINAEIQKTHLLKSYYAKLKKQLSAESIFNYFNAERSFRKELMNNWKKKPQGPRK